MPQCINRVTATRLTIAHDTPGQYGHSLISTHGDDITLEIPCLGGESTLVDGERSQTVSEGITICLCYDPGRRVTDSKVEDPAFLDEDVEGLHQLWYICAVIPAVDEILLACVSLMGYSSDLGGFAASTRST